MPATGDLAVLLVYGEEHTNLALVDELVLDGYEVHRASDPAMLRAACDMHEIALVIFGRAADRGAGLDVLRRLRAGEFAPEVDPRLRALWMSPNGDLGDVLRRFAAGADDVIRSPFAYPEFRARAQALIMRRDLTETPGLIEYRELRIDTQSTLTLRADLLGEPLASCLARYAERDPDFAPGPSIGASARHELAHTGLAGAHRIDGLCERT